MNESSAVDEERIEQAFTLGIESVLNERQYHNDYPNRTELMDALVDAQYALVEEPGYNPPNDRVVVDYKEYLVIEIGDIRYLFVDDRRDALVDAVSMVYETTARKIDDLESSKTHPIGILIKPNDPEAMEAHE